MFQQPKVNILSLLQKPNFDIKYLLGFNPLKEKPPKSVNNICECGCRTFSTTNICVYIICRIIFFIYLYFYIE